MSRSRSNQAAGLALDGLASLLAVVHRHWKDVGLGVLVLLAVTIVSFRVSDWQSDDTLWRKTSYQLQSNARALINLHEVQLAHLDVRGHMETCAKLRDLQKQGQLDSTELWITDHICLSR